MRDPKRIPIILENIKWHEYLSDIKAIPVGRHTMYKDTILENIELITEEWNENPDWRLSQVLVNTGVLPNYPGFWYYDEDFEILERQNFNMENVLKWGVNFTKDMIKLPKTKWTLIKDLNSDHIQAILNGKFTGNPLYLRTFKKVLKDRAVLNENND